MAHLALWVLMAVLPVCVRADYSVFHENGKAGIKDDAGNITLAATYDYLYPLSNSHNARFGGGGTFGMLDMRDGTVLLPVKYKLIGDFYNGLAVVAINGKRGYVDVNGNFVFEPQFDDAASFYAGTAEVTRDGRRFYISVDGKEYDTRPQPEELARQDYTPAPRAAKESAKADAGKKEKTAKQPSAPAKGDEKNGVTAKTTVAKGSSPKRHVSRPPSLPPSRQRHRASMSRAVNCSDALKRATRQCRLTWMLSPCVCKKPTKPLRTLSVRKRNIICSISMKIHGRWSMTPN